MWDIVGCAVGACVCDKVCVGDEADDDNDADGKYELGGDVTCSVWEKK
jgi:hypothetical protein